MIVFAGSVNRINDLNTGENIPQSGATAGGITKSFINTDSLEDKFENVIEQLKIMNLHLSHITDMWIDREDIDSE